MIKLTPNELTLIKKILAEIIPNKITWAFGSRVHGKPKKYSDLDLAIITETPLSPLIMSQLREAFDESNLPFQVDLVDWAQIHADFKKIIKEHYFPLQ